jgi:hypothetical protein
VPAKPSWYRDLEAIIQQLEALPRPFVDRATVEVLLGVGRRRAQQVIAPCITHHVGANGLVDRDAMIVHLRRLARTDDASYERIRRRKVAELLEDLRKDRLAHPQVLVEAPTAVVNQEIENLPPGVRIEPGRILVEFTEPRQALEKLLALAMAIGNDYDRFEQLATNQVATR